MARASKYPKPYVDSKGKPVIRDSYCALIDILGFAQMIRDGAATGNSNAVFESVRHALGQSTDYFKHMRAPSKYFKTPPSWEYKLFTDNLLLGFPKHPNNPWPDAESEFGSVIQYIVQHQATLALNGYFSRGGLTYGELHVSNDLAFGVSLLEAYEIERDIAVFPRIVLGQSAEKKLIEQLKSYGDFMHAPHNHSLLVDEDGLTFVNYLSELNPDPGQFYWDELLDHKEWIQQRLEEHQGNNNPLTKYEWLAAYHNLFCREWARAYGDIRNVIIRGAPKRNFVLLYKKYQPTRPFIHGAAGTLYRQQGTGRVVRARKAERELKLKLEHNKGNESPSAK